MRSTPACSGIGCGMADHRAHFTLAAITHHTAPLTASHQGRPPAHTFACHTFIKHASIYADKAARRQLRHSKARQLQWWQMWIHGVPVNNVNNCKSEHPSWALCKTRQYRWARLLGTALDLCLAMRLPGRSASRLLLPSLSCTSSRTPSSDSTACKPSQNQF